MTRFDEDIGLIKTSAGHYDALIADSWSVTIGPNGGYIAAILMNAMLMELGDKTRQVRSISFHFLSPSKPGPATLTAKVHKLGRSLATLTSEMKQNDRVIAMALATFAPPRENISFRDFQMPEVTGPEEINVHERMNSQLRGHVPFRDHYDQRLAIGPVPPVVTSKARVGGWSRFKDPRLMDSLAIVAISDSWFPGIMVREQSQHMHAPTIDHSVHFFTSLPLAGMKDDDFVLLEFTTEIVQEGYLQEDGRIWSRQGILIAQSRQLAVLLPRD